MTPPHASARRRQILPLIFLFLTLNLATRAYSITFDLWHGQRKCFTEDLPPSSTVQGTVHVASGKSEMQLDLFVTNNQGVVVFNHHDVNSVKFSFNTAKFRELALQEYRFCIINQLHPQAAHTQPTMRRVTLDVKVVKNDRSDEISLLAKQEHADNVYAEFLDVSNSVDGLIEKMDSLRVAEQNLTDLNEQTATAILRISVIACLFTIGTGVLNFLSLKSFFKRKKLA